VLDRLNNAPQRALDMIRPLNQGPPMGMMPPGMMGYPGQPGMMPPPVGEGYPPQPGMYPPQVRRMMMMIHDGW
jgi:hypothetical protein